MLGTRKKGRSDPALSFHIQSAPLQGILPGLLLALGHREQHDGWKCGVACNARCTSEHPPQAAFIAKRRIVAPRAVIYCKKSRQPAPPCKSIIS